MTEFLGNGLLFVAIIGAIAFGCYELWKRGKLSRVPFVPKPPAAAPTATEEK